MLQLSCADTNDLYHVLMACGISCSRHDTAARAVKAAAPGDGVLLLADGYPEQPTTIDPEVVEAAASGGLHLYVEYPQGMPGLTTGETRDITLERVVVASETFGPQLPTGRILMMHGCRYLPLPARPAQLALARVAGFDTAVYGLPNNTHPILFEHTPDLLVATTKLSHFVTARYAPAECWEAVWRWILAWAGTPLTASLAWTPTVRPSYHCEAPLPAEIEREALQRGIDWFRHARMLVDDQWEAEADRRRLAYPDGTGPGPEADWPVGDGRCGVLEGVSSAIRHDGSQFVRYYLRNDCAGETAMAMAVSSALSGASEERNAAANLSNFLFFHSNLAENHRTSPQYPLHGLLRFSTDELYGHAYYGDDTARSVLGVLTVAHLLNDSQWDKAVLRTLLATLRTTGPQGFRGCRLEEGELLQRGWRFYRDEPRVNYRPHYEGWVWAAYLRAWEATGYRPFLTAAQSAIAMTMAAYPDGWHWTNGIQQERARMLLPLAWLVRVEDTTEHRRWLRQMTEALLAGEDACGAIREELGRPEMGRYAPPATNAAYGADEAPLIQHNGDPLCDLLYTMNFALVGLHEAAAATGESAYAEAEERMVRFLCRIQVRSEAHQALDGAWFRAFDYRHWEYWASNSDQSWGAWCVETGWTQAWITTVLGMRLLGTSLWALTGGTQLGLHCNALVRELM